VKDKKVAIIVGTAIGVGGLAALLLSRRAAAAPPGAKFRVSGLNISPEEVNPGQPVTISVIVANIGGEVGSYTVILEGDFMAQENVTLAPGWSRLVSFEVTPTGTGTYSVSVDGLYGSFVATTAPVADIRVEDLVISPTEVYVGEPVTISVRVTNYGTVAGSKTITCTVS